MEKKKRGFAAMSPEKRFAAQSKGGKNAHEFGVAYEWDSRAAVEAGTIGGRNSAAKRAATRTVSVSSELVPEAPSSIRLRDDGDGPERGPDSSVRSAAAP